MNYSALTVESEAELERLERKHKRAVERDRIRFLKVLKTGQETAQLAAGQTIGIGERQAQRLWQSDPKAGLAALMLPPERRGWGKISSQQMSHLRRFLQDDQAQTLAHIQAYLAGSLGLTYSISGVGSLCQRLNVKPETGRPVNVRQAPGAVEGFKKNSVN